MWTILWVWDLYFPGFVKTGSFRNKFCQVRLLIDSIVRFLQSRSNRCSHTISTILIKSQHHNVLFLFARWSHFLGACESNRKQDCQRTYDDSFSDGSTERNYSQVLVPAILKIYLLRNLLWRNLGDDLSMSLFLESSCQEILLETCFLSFHKMLGSVLVPLAVASRGFWITLSGNFS